MVIFFFRPLKEHKVIAKMVRSENHLKRNLFYGYYISKWRIPRFPNMTQWIQFFLYQSHPWRSGQYKIKLFAISVTKVEYISSSPVVYITKIGLVSKPKPKQHRVKLPDNTTILKSSRSSTTRWHRWSVKWWIQKPNWLEWNTSCDSRRE